MKWHLKRLKINYSSRVSWSLIGIVIYSSLVSVLGIQSKLIYFLLQGIFPGPGIKLMAPAMSPELQADSLSLSYQGSYKCLLEIYCENEQPAHGEAVSCFICSWSSHACLSGLLSSTNISTSVLPGALFPGNWAKVGCVNNTMNIYDCDIANLVDSW